MKIIGIFSEFYGSMTNSEKLRIKSPVTYGTKAAPFLVVRALFQLVDNEGHSFPLAVLSLKHGRYVDDIFRDQTLLKNSLKSRNN